MQMNCFTTAHKFVYLFITTNYHLREAYLISGLFNCYELKCVFEFYEQILEARGRI